MSNQIFEELWGMWPQNARRNTKGNPSKKKTPMEWCRHLTDEALKKGVSPTTLIAAARGYIQSRDEQYVMGLHRWLRDEKWRDEDAAVTGNASKIVAVPVRGKRWESATGEVKRCLSAMHEIGCPEDVLDGLYADVTDVTRVNCDRGMPPTLVLGSHYGMNLFYKAASGYAERAGYNGVAYSPEYVAFARDRIAKRNERATITAAREVSEPSVSIDRAMSAAEELLDTL